MVDCSNGCSEVICFHFVPSYITVSMCTCIHTSQYDDTIDLRVLATIDFGLECCRNLTLTAPATNAVLFFLPAKEQHVPRTCYARGHATVFRSFISLCESPRWSVHHGVKDSWLSADGAYENTNRVITTTSDLAAARNRFQTMRRSNNRQRRKQFDDAEIFYKWRRVLVYRVCTPSRPRKQ